MSDMTTTVMGTQGGIRVDELACWIEQGPTPNVLDLREPADFAASHIPDCANAPLSASADLLRRLAVDGMTVLVCDGGDLSRRAAQTLASCGYRSVSWLAGGVRAWCNSGRGLVGAV